jgi:hypothetical protein
VRASPERTTGQLSDLRQLCLPSYGGGNTPMKRTPPRSGLRPIGGGIGYSREFLERLAQILVHTGHSPKKLAREFREICDGLKEPAHTWDPAYLNYLADLPHVIARWHADPQFVDSQGDPIALPLKSRNLSLTSLIGRVLPAEDASAVIESLIRLRGIRRQGRFYVPTDRQLWYTRQSARVHGLMALLGILRTLEYNVSRATPSSTILERAAVNPRFPVRALPAFHRWLKTLAAKFLWDADGNMRRRESRFRSEPTIRLGVGVFAFEDPLITGTRARKVRPHSRKRSVRQRRRTTRRRIQGKR